MISKELLSEVMKKEVEYVESNLCYFEEFSSCMQGITFKGNSHREYWNIYELVDVCKKWAFGKGFEIVVLAYSIKIYNNGYEIYNTNTTLFDLDMFFSSCQWILES